MAFPKKILAASLIGASIIIGIFLVGLGAYQKPSLKNVVSNNLLDKTAEKTARPELAKGYESLESLPLKSEGNQVIVQNETVSEPNNATVNLTQEFAKKIARQMIEKNPLGPALLGDTRQLNVVGPETFVDDFLAHGLSNLDTSILQPNIDIKSLKIIKAGGQTSQLTYLNELNRILRIGIGEIKFDPLHIPDSADFENLHSLAEKTYNQLLATYAPESLLSAHIKELEILGSFKNIFEVLARLEQDPLKAVVALRAIPLLNVEFANLNQKLTQAVNSNTPFNL